MTNVIQRKQWSFGDNTLGLHEKWAVQESWLKLIITWIAPNTSCCWRNICYQIWRNERFLFFLYLFFFLYLTFFLFSISSFAFFFLFLFCLFFLYLNLLLSCCPRHFHFLAFFRFIYFFYFSFSLFSCNIFSLSLFFFLFSHCFISFLLFLSLSVPLLYSFFFFSFYSSHSMLYFLLIHSLSFLLGLYFFRSLVCFIFLTSFFYLYISNRLSFPYLCISSHSPLLLTSNSSFIFFTFTYLLTRLSFTTFYHAFSNYSYFQPHQSLNLIFIFYMFISISLHFLVNCPFYLPIFIIFYHPCAQTPTRRFSTPPYSFFFTHSYFLFFPFTISNTPTNAWQVSMLNTKFSENLPEKISKR